MAALGPAHRSTTSHVQLCALLLASEVPVRDLLPAWQIRYSRCPGALSNFLHDAQPASLDRLPPCAERPLKALADVSCCCRLWIVNTNSVAVRAQLAAFFKDAVQLYTQAVAQQGAGPPCSARFEVSGSTS